VAATGHGPWIAFDVGAATLPANASNQNSNPGVAGSGFTNFIGAIGSSGDFSKVTFRGDGYGEFPVAGGMLRFCSAALNSVGIPEPGTLAIVGRGLIGLATSCRNRA
jgi:hypothetical protein